MWKTRTFCSVLAEHWDEKAWKSNENDMKMGSGVERLENTTSSFAMYM